MSSSARVANGPTCSIPNRSAPRSVTTVADTPL